MLPGAKGLIPIRMAEAFSNQSTHHPATGAGKYVMELGEVSPGKPPAIFLDAGVFHRTWGNAAITSEGRDLALRALSAPCEGHRPYLQS